LVVVAAEHVSLNVLLSAAMGNRGGVFGGREWPG